MLPWSLLAAFSLWQSFAAERKLRFEFPSKLIESSALICLVIVTVLCLCEGEIEPLFAGDVSVSLDPACATIQKIGNQKLIILALAAALCARAGEVGIYNQYRNRTRSVAPLVQDLRAHLDPAQPLYSLEMQKRWILYYLKENGIKTIRMTHGLAEQLSADNTPVAVLLSSNDEDWRLSELQRLEPATEIVKDYEKEKSQVTLVKTDSESTRRSFPARRTFRRL